MFTVNTEADEIACIMRLKIPVVPTRGRDSLKRKVREEQEKEEWTLPSLAQALRRHPRASRVGVRAYVYLVMPDIHRGLYILYRSGEE